VSVPQIDRPIRSSALHLHLSAAAKAVLSTPMARPQPAIAAAGGPPWTWAPLKENLPRLTASPSCDGRMPLADPLCGSDL